MESAILASILEWQQTEGVIVSTDTLPVLSVAFQCVVISQGTTGWPMTGNAVVVIDDTLMDGWVKLMI